MATAVQSSPSPAPPVSKMDSIYELRYRKGGLIHTVFFSWSDRTGAIEKAKEYCEKRELRFIYVSEWLQDIQKLIDFEPDEGYKR